MDQEQSLLKPVCICRMNTAISCPNDGHLWFRPSRLDETNVCTLI